MKFISLKNKAVILVSFICICLFSLAYYYCSINLTEGFLTLEEDDARINLARVNDALIADAENLVTKVGVLSKWDDLYFYIKYKNSNFGKTNFTSSMTNLKLDVFSFWKLDKQFVWAANFDLMTEVDAKKVNPFSKTLLSSIQNLSYLFTPKDSTGAKYYFVRLLEGPYLIISSPISTSNGKSLANGIVIAGIKLDANYFAILGKKLHLNLDSFDLQNKNIPFEISRKAAAIKDGQLIMEKNNDQQLVTYGLIKSENLQDLILFKLNIPRHIYLHGKKIMSVYLKSMIFSGILLVLFVIIIIEKLIASSIAKLSSIIKNIKTGQNFNQDMSNLVHYEIGDIGVSFYEILAEVENLRKASINNEKLASLGEMAGGIAHEINNPIAIISASSNLIRKMFIKGVTDQDKYIKQLDDIDKTILRISKIIIGLKNISRDSSDEDMSAYAIADLLIDSLSVCNEKLKLNGIQVKFNQHDPIFTTQISCFRVQLTQVFLNLFNNSFDAIENTPHPWIEVNASIIEEKLIIKFSDSGKGIPFEIQSKIFQPFYTTKDLGKGTGLGLSLCNMIILRHNGKLFIDNDAKNTCFVISLTINEVKNVA